VAQSAGQGRALLPNLDAIVLERSWAAIVALSASAVPAQDRLTKDDLATLAATLGVYDSRCETLPPGLRADLQRMIRLLDKDDLMARGLNEQEKIDRAGEAKWCDAYRPVIEKYKDGLFEPTR
jgi:hypothetical protein